jgi:hypothetical protein
MLKKIFFLNICLRWAGPRPHIPFPPDLIWAKFQRIIEVFNQKIVTKLSKIWIWDPGSEIRDPEKNLFRIPDPGVKKAPNPGSGSATLTFYELKKKSRMEATTQYFEKLFFRENRS